MANDATVTVEFWPWWIFSSGASERDWPERRSSPAVVSGVHLVGRWSANFIGGAQCGHLWCDCYRCKRAGLVNYCSLTGGDGGGAGMGVEFRNEIAPSVGSRMATLLLLSFFFAPSLVTRPSTASLPLDLWIDRANLVHGGRLRSRVEWWLSVNRQRETEEWALSVPRRTDSLCVRQTRWFRRKKSPKNESISTRKIQFPVLGTFETVKTWKFQWIILSSWYLIPRSS